MGHWVFITSMFFFFAFSIIFRFPYLYNFSLKNLELSPMIYYQFINPADLFSPHPTPRQTPCLGAKRLGYKAWPLIYLLFLWWDVLRVIYSILHIFYDHIVALGYIWMHKFSLREQRICSLRARHTESTMFEAVEWWHWSSFLCS